MKKKTTAAINSLEYALSQLSTAQKREDEFTIDEFIQSLAAKGEWITASSTTSRLNTLLTKGLLTRPDSAGA
ncbi:MAG: hypothetical protein KGQ87_03835 [Verrucomicrobia bacterium]|nr:hypothetical protein [Verrucomicrobiota bacterium]